MHSSWKKLRLAACAAVISLAISCAAQAQANLGAYNIDKTNITVSGLSAGGFMANQLGMAHSSVFKGIGVFAGGPYMCAGQSNYTACMNNATISATMLTNMQNTIDSWSGVQIDNRANVAGQKIFMFVGNSDTTVGPNPMNALQTQYSNNGVAASNLQYVKRNSTAHVFPTDFDSTGNNTCSTTASPYISNCGYDGAKEVLTHFYGTLNARNNAPASGNYIQFNQAEFTSNPGMASTGWLYVPANCASGSQCKLHVALHGCKQSYGDIGDKYIKNTGYTRWADTNSMIVLFPQTKVDSISRSTAASGSLPNPNACWDWIGWYGSNFAQKAGTQVTALKAMVDRVSSGGGGGGTTTLAAPTGVLTSNATTTSMKISWSAVSGAASYNVYRNSNKVNALGVNALNYTDNGLTAATTYQWAVRAADANGVEGATSAVASGTTLGSTPATCYTSSNYSHVLAGRAYVYFGLTYANGSGQSMGLYNIFVSTTLKKTGSNYYIIGSCP